MCKSIFIGILSLLGLAACAPAATALPTAAPTPTILPSPAAAVVENPPACATANMVYHSQLHEVLMTGCTPTSGEGSESTAIWGWNGEHWRRVAEGGPAPLVLGGAAYEEARDVLVLYGGYSFETSTCTRETWEWDGESWSQKDVESPTACDHLEMAYDASRGDVILFGGGDENQNLSTETWSWDGANWTKVAEAEPPGRAHFGLVYDPAHEQMLLYGGYADRILEDFWAWKQGRWQEIDFSGPGPLSHFGMALDGNALLIFGGASSTSTFSSLSDRTWKLTDGRWSELQPGDHPSKRGSPAMVSDPDRGRIVLYGGFGPDRKELNDTWEWDGSRWQCRANCP